MTRELTRPGREGESSLVIARLSGAHAMADQSLSSSRARSLGSWWLREVVRRAQAGRSRGRPLNCWSKTSGYDTRGC